MIKINYDRIVRTQWHAGFPRGESRVKTIVIHGTGGGGTLAYVRSGGRKELYVKGIALFHDLIERDGTVWNLIDHENYVYHSSSGAFDKGTIGIELVNPDAGNNLGYTDEQYSSLMSFIFEKLLIDYPHIESIVSHNWTGTTFSKRGKNCPGKFFEWDRFDEVFKKYGYAYSAKLNEGFMGIYKVV